MSDLSWFGMELEPPKQEHPAARIGFERSSRLYDRARSTYPEANIKRLYQHMGVHPWAKVLELASGTGKLTGSLKSYFSDLTLVEPNPGMRTVLAEMHSDLGIFSDQAERLPFSDSTFDAVFCATAFHWFDAPKAYREICRILKPGGSLGLIWTAWWDLNSLPGWYKDLRSLTVGFEGDTPRYRHMKWREPFDQGQDFAPLQFENFDNSRPMTAHGILERFMSISYIAALPEILQNALRIDMQSKLTMAIERGEVLRLPEEIHIYWTRKRS